ncbi:hypothetical protein DPMN_032721 [Dreissena polymorpha]|uniref:Uncharacterized protein n=1 Tax=Dreissena polymorpha TaxID=45954 RepID=A0A9D4RKD0_DREPO|nr:hypothetical protein DPMN_032721 [Dreissena polymorpha]
MDEVFKCVQAGKLSISAAAKNSVPRMTLADICRLVMCRDAMVIETRHDSKCQTGQSGLVVPCRCDTTYFMVPRFHVKPVMLYETCQYRIGAVIGTRLDSFHETCSIQADNDQSSII